MQTYTVTDALGAPIEGCHILVTSVVNGTGPVDEGYSNALGQWTFIGQIDVTYYLWRTKVGFTFTDPDTEVGKAA